MRRWGGREPPFNDGATGRFDGMLAVVVGQIRPVWSKGLRAKGRNGPRLSALRRDPAAPAEERSEPELLVHASGAVVAILHGQPHDPLAERQPGTRCHDRDEQAD